MLNTLKYILLFCIVGLTGCASNDLHKDVELEAVANANVNLSGYKSYAWLMGADVLYDPDRQWQSRGIDYDAEVRFFINQELRDKGLKENNFKPELAVVYGLGVNMKSQRLVHDDAKNIDEIKNVPEGGIVIALVDVKMKKPVWIGRAKGALQNNNTIEQDEQRIKYVLSELFDRLYKPDRTVKGDARKLDASSI